LDFPQLEMIIKKTIEKINEERLLKENSTSWIQNKRTLLKQFWKDFFLGEISPNKESLNNYFRQKRLDIRLDYSYLPILIVTKKWMEPLNKDDQKLLQYALRNITEELVVIPEAEHEVIPFSETSILIMLQMDGCLEVNPIYSQIEHCCRQVTEAAVKYIKEVVCCYVGVKESIYEMPSVIESLQEMDFNNVIHQSNIFYLHLAKNKEAYPHSENPIDQWREWIQQERYNQVQNEIEERLTPHKQKVHMNRDFLKRFIMDFQYLIFSFASDRSIFINELFGDEQLNQLLEKASESLDDLRTWVTYAMGVMKSFDQDNANRDNPIERTKQFIQMHLADEISMDHIANNVHLNADYLTRIFKKEVGVSISKYMINKKIEKAKELLVHTNKSIGEVATIVGYYNYSSFNRIFTKETGVSPQEFKNRNKI